MRLPSPPAAPRGFCPCPCPQDEAEWRQWRSVGDPVLHIELRRWADVLLVAPLSANSLAKMAGGMADNLLTCVVRAWDFRKPLLLAPAMNTAMWASPFTARHLETLQQVGAAAGGAPGGGVRVIPPVSKRLACGDEGTGAMASPEDIAIACRAAVTHLLGGQEGHHGSREEQPQDEQQRHQYQ
ncbi:hypothetical protein GPECTOR_6g799 [Gonium pectorale]|uniref:phosphopantothenoylcysteine decarboxylase n=1 Tax=Gonium pectorale TaxID=33097 RepID=A0A150GVL7_GONPE|nr:hypothetical protein GPECTOR_6g799 [Gonium pectorale]|eukprot:KXZ53881.1 hypothetical protein GPECTOR_6g799 [Gonium pectorale]